MLACHPSTRGHPSVPHSLSCSSSPPLWPWTVRMASVAAPLLTAPWAARTAPVSVGDGPCWGFLELSPYCILWAVTLLHSLGRHLTASLHVTLLSSPPAIHWQRALSLYPAIATVTVCSFVMSSHFISTHRCHCLSLQSAVQTCKGQRASTPEPAAGACRHGETLHAFFFLCC